MVNRKRKQVVSIQANENTAPAAKIQRVAATRGLRVRNQNIDRSSETQITSEAFKKLQIKNVDKPAPTSRRTRTRNSLNNADVATSSSSSNNEQPEMSQNEKPILDLNQPMYGENVWAIAGRGCPPGRHVNPLPPKVEDIDDRTDTAYCREYAKDIFSYLTSLQYKYAPKNDFLTANQSRREKGASIKDLHRAILVDWIVEVAQDHMLLSDTLFLCVTYIDRVLSKIEINRSQLQLLGCACLLIAAKYEEQYPPHVEELAAVTDHTYTKEMILDMESKSLSALDFRLTTSTTKTFVRRFQRVLHVTPVEKFLCDYILELSLLAYELVPCPADHVAAACIFATRVTLFSKDSKNTALYDSDDCLRPGKHFEIFPKSMAHYCGFTPEYLANLVVKLIELHVGANNSRHRAIVDKYAQGSFNRVATRVKPYTVSGSCIPVASPESFQIEFAS